MFPNNVNFIVLYNQFIAKKFFPIFWGKDIALEATSVADPDCSKVALVTTKSLKLIWSSRIMLW